MESEVYLKPNVVIEPLFDRWYAWSHLISPATASMNIRKRHLKIMDSYIQAPQIHAAAVRNPKMLGGPFMDLGGGRVQEVKDLKARTLHNQGDLLELASAIDDLDAMLKKNATGFSLESLYEKVPDILKGYVELVYDLNNTPSFRFFEPLLFESKFYKKESQSIALWCTENDERPFVLSTPRLDSPGIVHLDISFESRSIDELAKMKRVPQTISCISKQLNVPAEKMESFRQLFTTEPYRAYKKYEGDKIRMRYFGHACILIETRDITVLVDPLISYYGYQADVNRFSDYDLPEVIDYVLITHNHQDHILYETLLPLRHKIRNIIVPATTSGSLQDPSLYFMFRKLGFDNVKEIRNMDTLTFTDCTITGIPFIGEHCDLNIQCKSCYHLKIGSFTVLFAADSCNIEPALYQRIHGIIGDIDIICVGMECEGAPLSWLYGPLMAQEPPRDMDRSRTLSGSNFPRAKALVAAFNPKEVYVYAMGMEPWLEFISSKRYKDQDHPIVESNKLVEYCRGLGIESERLYGEKELLRERDMVV